MRNRGAKREPIFATKVGPKDRCVKAPSIRMGTDGHGWTVWALFWTFWPQIFNKHLRQMSPTDISWESRVWRGINLSRQILVLRTGVLPVWDPRSQLQWMRPQSTDFIKDRCVTGSTRKCWGPMCQPRNKNILRTGVSPAEKKKLSLARMTCLADKTNHPVERLSLNRSQCGSCSTKYDTSAGT